MAHARVRRPGALRPDSCPRGDKQYILTTPSSHTSRRMIPFTHWHTSSKGKHSDGGMDEGIIQDLRRSNGRNFVHIYAGHRCAKAFSISALISFSIVDSIVLE